MFLTHSTHVDIKCYTHTHLSACVCQLYSLFLTAAAGHVTEAQSNAAAWASAMHAGTQAMRRCNILFLIYLHVDWIQVCDGF